LRKTKNLSTPFVLSKPKEVESLFHSYFWMEGVMVKVMDEDEFTPFLLA
jgi:hypothetical protein